MQSNAAQVQRLMQLSAFAGRIMCDAYQAGNLHRAYHFMRNRLNYVPANIVQFLTKAVSDGIELDHLQEMALNASNWTRFRGYVEGALE